MFATNHSTPFLFSNLEAILTKEKESSKSSLLPVWKGGLQIATSKFFQICVPKTRSDHKNLVFRPFTFNFAMSKAILLFSIRVIDLIAEFVSNAYLLRTPQTAPKSTTSPDSLFLKLLAKKRDPLSTFLWENSPGTVKNLFLNQWCRFLYLLITE